MSSNKKIRFCNRCNRTFKTNKQRPKRCPNCKSLFWHYPWMCKINQNNTPPKSEERSHRHLSSTVGAVTPCRLIIVAIFVVSISLMAWFLTLPPSCNPERQVQLTGILMGFEKNEARWSVRIDNKSYVFNHFDKGYMERMLGFNVTIVCCLRTSDFKPYFVYSVLSCYINDNLESDV